MQRENEFLQESNMEVRALDSNVRVFLKKFIASLHCMGVKTIPFSGEDFYRGVSKMDETLKSRLYTDTYNEISDIFIKTPVQERYNYIRDKLMTLNGDMIGFSSAENPYWNSISIKTNNYYAQKILNDQSILDINNDTVNAATKSFCDAAGIFTWAQS
jgi:hypothetical protein